MPGARVSFREWLMIELIYAHDAVIGFPTGTESRWLSLWSFKLLGGSLLKSRDIVVGDGFIYGLFPL